MNVCPGINTSKSLCQLCFRHLENGNTSRLDELWVLLFGYNENLTGCGGAWTQEAKTRQTDLRVQSQPGLRSEFQDYTGRTYFEGKKSLKVTKLLKPREPLEVTHTSNPCT